MLNNCLEQNKRIDFTREMVLKNIPGEKNNGVTFR